MKKILASALLLAVVGSVYPEPSYAVCRGSTCAMIARNKLAARKAAAAAAAAANPTPAPAPAPTPAPVAPATPSVAPTFTPSFIIYGGVVLNSGEPVGGATAP